MSAEAFAPQTGRWGDYSALTVDPIDDCTFWYTTEYFAAGDPPGLGAWHTRVGSFKFSQCTARPVGLLRGFVTDTSGNPLPRVSITAGGYTAFTNDNGIYQFSPLAPGGYTASASQSGYFPSSQNVTLTDGGVTEQNFILDRNTAEPTPTPVPALKPLDTVNPPVLNDPGVTITTNNYSVSWSAAEVTTGLSGYVIEESTDYVNPLFDNADGTTPPGQSGSLWTSGDINDPWTPNPAYHHSVPNSYFANPEDSGFTLAIDTSLALQNSITIPSTVGSARLNFFSRYYNDPDDTGNVEISKNGGTTWTSLKILNDAPSVPPADTRMQNHEIDLTPYRGMPIKLRFRYNTDRSIYPLIHSTGWWVDDITVDGATWTQVGTTNATTTSLSITGKPNGHYYYRVRAVYSSGHFTTNSNVQDIVVNAPAPPQLVTVVSRKSHGGADFDVALPLTGTRGVECRTGDVNLIFTFAAPVTNCGTATQGTASAGPTSTQCTVTLSAPATRQYYQIGLNGVVSASGGSANFPGPQWGMLIGDVNASGVVTSGDTNLCKAQALHQVTTSNFRDDINATGSITTGDVNLIKQHALEQLPTTP